MKLARFVSLALGTALAGTTASGDPGSTAQALPGGALPAFAAQERVAGRTLEAWAERWWQWTYGIPADENPFLHDDASCDVHQSGPVFFLPSTIDPGGVATMDRSCAVPEGKPILVSPSGALNDFPCPDPGFQPPPGVPLFDFLKDGIAPIVNSVSLLSASVDGVAIPAQFAYRTQGSDAFEIEGDPSLQAALDPCITGAPQPAVSDGYFFVLRPLAPGAHTLDLRATDTRGTDLTVHWHLDVAPR